MNPRCELPGCGLEMVPKPPAFYKDPESWRCPRNDDAHALCKRVAELETLAKSVHKAESERDEARSQLRESQECELALREILKDVIGDHSAPNDCYATGPMTGNALYDLVRCPACCAIKYLSNTSATAQRVKDEWEREAVEKVIGTITDPANEIVWIRPAQGSIHADPRFIRAAILGEKP